MCVLRACVRVCVLPPFSNPSEARCLPVYWKLNVKKKGNSDSSDWEINEYGVWADCMNVNY